MTAATTAADAKARHVALSDIELLRALSSRPMSCAEMAAHTGVAHAYFDRQLLRLLDRGLVERVSVGGHPCWGATSAATRLLATSSAHVTNASAQFAALVAERQQLGASKHAPDYLHGPSLLRPLALEAIDATNYAVMELERLLTQHPDALAAHASVRALAYCLAGYAELAADALNDHTGERLDIGAVAIARCNGPAADEYRFGEFLWRPSNYRELVQELADAHILAGFERDRRWHPAGDGAPDPMLERLAQISEALALAALDLEAEVLPAYPPPPAPQQPAAAGWRGPR